MAPYFGSFSTISTLLSASNTSTSTLTTRNGPYISPIPLGSISSPTVLTVNATSTPLPPIDPNVGKPAWTPDPTLPPVIPIPTIWSRGAKPSLRTVTVGSFASVETTYTTTTTTLPCTKAATSVQTADEPKMTCETKCTVPLLVHSCTVECHAIDPRDALSFISASTPNPVLDAAIASNVISEGDSDSDSNDDDDDPTDHVGNFIVIGMFVILSVALGVGFVVAYLRGRRRMGYWPWKSQEQKVAERQRKTDKQIERQLRRAFEKYNKERKEALEAGGLPNGWEFQWPEGQIGPSFFNYRYTEAGWVKDPTVQAPESCKEGQQPNEGADVDETVARPELAAMKAGMPDVEATAPPAYEPW